MAIYFGFAVSDSMFDDNLIVERKTLSVDEVRAILDTEVIPCVNPSHVATLAAMEERFGLRVEIPATPPRVSLSHGDSLVVMTVQGLPRLTDRHEYTEAEIANATFSFARWSVQ